MIRTIRRHPVLQPVLAALTLFAIALPSTALAAPTRANAPASVNPVSEASVLDSLSATIGSRPADATVAAQPASPANGSGTNVWEGTAAEGAYVRRAPERAGAPVRQLKAGEAIEVMRWVTGEEVEPNNTTWAELSDGTFVFSTLLRRAPLSEPPARPADAPESGRWIDVNLTEQVATAYDGATAIRMVLISAGRPGWDTPTGTFSIGRRAEKDTMDGSTLIGQGPNGQGATYKIENVKHVQYFTSDGAAIHENTWRQAGTFGIPGSHGCIGMTPADAAFFWTFATHGTPVVIHE